MGHQKEFLRVNLKEHEMVDVRDCLRVHQRDLRKGLQRAYLMD